MVKRLSCLAPFSALTLALGLGAGCTSDDPNGVGAGLTDIGLDSLLVAVTLTQPDHYGALEVTNEAEPLDEREVLYLGADGNDASSILVTFDFSKLPYDLWTEDLLREDNISSVLLQLQLLEWYSPNHGADPLDEDSRPERYWTGAQKNYDVHILAAPLDTLGYPGPEPAYSPSTVNLVQPREPANGPIFVDLSKATVAGWLAARVPVSLIIREGAGSEPGLLGIASKEMVHGGSTLPRLRPGASLGPTLIIDTVEYPASLPDSLSNLVVRPVADVSTWHALEEPPASAADGILFRTHLREYPALGFDLADLAMLPRNVRINRAELTLVTDPARLAGPTHVMVASEVAPEFAPPGVTAVPLADLEPALYVVGGRSGLNPEDEESDTIAIDVTSSVQRYLNGAYEGRRVFLLTEGESFLTGWRANPAPDFWFRRRWFFGTEDADPARRPRLKIVYSRETELDEVRP